MLAWLGLSWASQGVVVQVIDSDGLLEGAPTVEIVDETGTSHEALARDDGRPPDVAAGDGTWGVLVNHVEGDSVVLAVTDGADRRWTDPFELARDMPTLTVTPTARGHLARSRRGLHGEHQGLGVPPDPTWTPPGVRRERWTPWGLLAWFAGFGLAALVLFWWADPGPIPGGGGELRRIRAPTESSRGRFLLDRRKEGPVVVAGAVPPGVTVDLVLGPGRVDVDDLLRAVAAFDGPVQVVITGDLETAGGVHGEAALVHLADHLPKGLQAFVLGETEEPHDRRDH